MNAVKILFFSMFLLLFETGVYSQHYVNFDCEAPTALLDANLNVVDPFEGLTKPTRSDRSGGASEPDGFFPVLVVFVEFPNDPEIIQWDNQEPPDYIDQMISLTNKTPSNGEWWNTYSESTEILSDQYMETSRGHLELVNPVEGPDGSSYHVILPHTPQEYYERAEYNYAQAELLINQDIWDALVSQGITDWRPYDRWRKDETDNKYYFCDLNDGDGYVDMIYKIHKTLGPMIDTSNVAKTILHGRGGYAYLGILNRSTEITVDGFGTKIQYGYSHKGSGLTVSGAMPREGYSGTIGHEHMHYLLLDDHNPYSRVSFGVGFDGFASPFDMAGLDYMDDVNFDYTSQTNFSLGDYSSRNSNQTGNIGRVVIEGTNEFFILASRNKVSYWDRVMLGDTAGSDFSPYDLNNDYGKGLYIYHTNNGYAASNYRDLECADGYWNWEYAGQHYQVVPYNCWQSGSTDWPYYKKTTPRYDNDPSQLGNTNFRGDGVSFHYHVSGSIHGALPKWWGVGKKEVDNCKWGTDRIMVNQKEVYTASENAGDRWDAWKPGYNEVFSPYSSPSTDAWDNDETGIFIYYHALSSGNAQLKIWRASENGGNTSLATILANTPPSRPMNLRIDTCSTQYLFLNRPKLIWNHNMEPDMKWWDEDEDVYRKTYNIYKSGSNTISDVPSESNYQLIATVSLDVTGDPVNAEYLDTSTIAGCNTLTDPQCPPICWVKHNIRYRVEAVDNTSWASVKSDFASMEAYRIDPNAGGGGTEDSDRPMGLHTEENPIPNEFALKQNYPNPFNPVTNIQYDLPRAEYVTIKVFDVLGKEVSLLINEFKQAGRYIISFDGSSLSSGIYFYKIQAGTFSQIRQMVLVK